MVTVKNEFGNSLKGFYLVGFFESRKKARWNYDDKKKPFETDENGSSRGIVYHFWKGAAVAAEWQFFECAGVKQVNYDNDLRNDMNDAWKSWCKKHKRKIENILIPLTKEEITKFKQKYKK